jgi:hypothetical protein
LFLATSMVAKYTAPGLTKWLLSRVLAGETDALVPLPRATYDRPIGVPVPRDR